MMKILFFLAFLLFISKINANKPCKARDYGNGIIVCVCDAKYCDDFEPIYKQDKGIVGIYETTQKGDRLKYSIQRFLSTGVHANITVTVNRNKKYQKIIGFGGAFTDAAGISISSLPYPLPSNIMKEFFGPNGLEYNTARVPIAGSDFSMRPYSYDDVEVEDKNLTHFKLAQEDFIYKIPFIRYAQQLTDNRLKLFGSVWSPPAWMKTNNKLNNGGLLKGEPGGEYYQAYADYLVKFLDAYKESGVKTWGITIVNEPKAGFVTDYSFNSLGFTPETQRDFIKLNLGPTLAKAGYGPDKLKVMINDDQRDQMLIWSDTILKDSVVSKYVSGIAYHWYNNKLAPPEIMDLTHAQHPDHFILQTEGGGGENWENAEDFSYEMITDLQHWGAGWVIWNLVLTTDGGQNWAWTYGNNLITDNPIVVNSTAKEYYKTASFYTMAHFTKFIAPDSVRIELMHNSSVPNFEIIGFQRPDNAVVVVALNMNNKTLMLNIDDPQHGFLSQAVPSRSILSFIWWD